MCSDRRILKISRAAAFWTHWRRWKRLAGSPNRTLCCNPIGKKTSATMSDWNTDGDTRQRTVRSWRKTAKHRETDVALHRYWHDRTALFLIRPVVLELWSPKSCWRDRAAAANFRVPDFCWWLCDVDVEEWNNLMHKCVDVWNHPKQEIELNILFNKVWTMIAVWWQRLMLSAGPLRR